MLWNRRRAKPKVFVVSLHRVGTQSTHTMLEKSGLKAIHWPAQYRGVDYQAGVVGHETDTSYIADLLAPVIAAFDVLSDVPICALYDSLAARYPDAFFLALTRPAADWVRSIRKHTDTRTLDPYEKTMFWRYLPGRPETLTDVSDADLVDMHRRHGEDMQSFFGGSERFKQLELYDPTAGEAICDFLGLPPRKLGHIDHNDGKRRLVQQSFRLARVAWEKLSQIAPNRSF